MLVEGAYQKLMAGDREGHDNLLVEKLGELAQVTDAVMLAQASMVRVLPRLSATDRDKFLVSPRLAMEQVQKIVSGLSPVASSQKRKQE